MINTTTPLPVPPRWRRAPFICERHPLVGDYYYWPTSNLWTNWRQTSEGHEFRLTGRSRCPTKDQLSLWLILESHLQELVSKSFAAVQSSGHIPVNDRFTWEKFPLSEMRMDSTGRTELFFDFPHKDDPHVVPIVSFRSLELKTWTWVV